MSVGTYVAASNTPVQGYHVVFDAAGGGVVYQTLNSASIQSGDRIMTLSNPVDVDMGGIKLTTNAIPVTMVGVAYLLDQVNFTAKDRLIILFFFLQYLTLSFLHHTS